MAYHRVNKNETTCKSDYLLKKKKTQIMQIFLNMLEYVI